MRQYKEPILVSGRVLFILKQYITVDAH